MTSIRCLGFLLICSYVVEQISTVLRIIFQNFKRNLKGSPMQTREIVMDICRIGVSFFDYHEEMGIIVI